MRKQFAAPDVSPGDQVEVPWGHERLIGTVREIYGPPGHPFVMVEVPVHGASGEVLETTTLGLPLDSLTVVG